MALCSWQSVHVTGYLKCTTGNWDYNYVWFDSLRIREAWKFVDETLSGRERARDTHRNSPEGSATFLVSKCNCECDWNKPWSFESTAVFKGYRSQALLRLSTSSPIVSLVLQRLTV